MAKTIYQRIALEGGKKIADDLRKIGKDGEAAFLELATASKKLSRNFGNLKGSIKDLGSGLKTMGTRLGIVGSAALGAVGGVVALAKSGTEMADAATKQAQAIGLAVDEYGRLSWAASQSGVDQATLATAMGRLNQTIGDVIEGNEKAADKFSALGISVTDAFGQVKPTEQLMAELADAFSKMPNGAQKSALAIDLFGRSGAQMIPMLNAGSSGLRDLGAEAERLGIVFTKEQATIAEGMNDALSALWKAVNGAKAQLGILFAPSITEGARALQKVIEDNRGALQTLVKDGLDKAVPLMRDLVNAVLGNDAAVKNSWILQTRDAVFGMANAIQSAITGIIIPAYDMLVSAADSVASVVNNIFGTDFTGQELLIDSVGLVANSFKLLGSSVNLVAKLGPVLGTAFSGVVAGAKLLLGALAPVLGWPALIIAALAGLAVLVWVYWDEIVAAAQWLWGELKLGFEAAWDLIKYGAGAALDWVAEKFSGIGAKFQEWGAKAGELFGAGLEFVAVSAAKAWDWIVQGGTIAAEAIGRGWAGISDLFAAVWRAITSGARNAWDYLRDGFEAVADWIGDLFDGVVRRIQSAWNKIKSLGSSIKSSASSIFDYTRSDDSAPAYATGGYVRGAGTGTSDSILARLSNGEFVIRAAAVRHYGPELLAALNGLKLPRLPGFSTGGLVHGLTVGMQPSLPRFAEGGLVAVPAGGGRPVNITIDGATYAMSASDDVAEKLGRHATSRRLKSAGRKPSWVGA